VDLTVVEVPQWQGSGSATARRLEEGAAVLAALAPADERARVPVSADLTVNAQATREVLAGLRGRAVLTVGGDCGVELAPVEAAVTAYGRRLAVVWFDAHGDLHTPESSPSGAAHGMILRTLLDHTALRPAQVVLAGVRALEPEEQAFIKEQEIARPALPELVAAVAATGAELVYVHIDLDVLDPRHFSSVGCPEPGGLSPAELIAAVLALAQRFELAGLGITEYEPGPDSADDERTVARILAAVAPALAGSTAHTVERRAAAAWPAAHAETVDGWVVRYSPQMAARRANSALPAAGSIEPVEAFYRGRGRPVIVQVTPAEQHGALDAELAARGYRREAPTLVLTAPAAPLATPPSVAVDLGVRPSDGWLRTYGKPMPEIPQPAAYAEVVVDGRVAAVGLLVAEAGWAGIFCMTTDPAQRRRGLALAILHAGAGWALAQGAERLYLQVEEDNDPARRLYERAGFTLSHSYHYRIA
jgi:arginase